MGQAKDRSRYGAARKSLQNIATAEEEAALKNARNYGGAGAVAGRTSPDRFLHQHFGLLLVSCDKADLRPLPTGVVIYADFEQRLDPLPPPQVSRSEVIDELYDALVHSRPQIHSGEWALATIEVCLAMLQSARENREIVLEHQIGLPQ